MQKADQFPVVEATKRLEVSEPSIDAWRKKLGDLGIDQVKYLKQLEQETNRLERVLAERDFKFR